MTLKYNYQDEFQLKNNVDRPKSLQNDTALPYWPQIRSHCRNLEAVQKSDQAKWTNISFSVCFSRFDRNSVVYSIEFTMFTYDPKFPIL